MQKKNRLSITKVWPRWKCIIDNSAVQISAIFLINSTNLHVFIMYKIMI